jgi:hypothetical protein
MHHAKLHIERLASVDTVVYSILMLGQKNDWTWEQTLIAMAIKQSGINKNLESKLNDAILNRAK